MLYESERILQFKEHKEPSKSSYVVTVPRKAIPHLNWDVKQMKNKKSLICMVDNQNRLIFKPKEQHMNHLSLFKLIEQQQKEQQEKYNDAKKNSKKLLKLHIESNINKMDLERLKVMLPLVQKDVSEAKEKLKLCEYALDIVKDKLKTEDETGKKPPK